MTHLQFVGLLIASALSPFVAAYVKKKGENLATQQDIEKLTAATKNIEARIARASLVHERQLDTLQRFCDRLWRVQGLCQQQAANFPPANVLISRNYALSVHGAVEEARNEFLNGQLLMPREMVTKGNSFFDEVSNALLAFLGVETTNNDIDKRERYWKEFRDIVYQKMAGILGEIDSEARKIIHGAAE